MSVLSLPVTGHTQVYINGDVVIDETAAIAPGVILQATAQGRIIIKAGACIGMGTVITASLGTIEIGEGAVLGAGVLIVGSGKIGDRACLGSASTLIETSITSGEFVSPGTLLGDTSRPDASSPSEPQPKSDNNGHHLDSESDLWDSVSPPSEEKNGSEDHSQTTAFSHPPAPTAQEQVSSPNSTDHSHQMNPNLNGSSEQESSSNTTIYGQTHIERLMVTLFPHKENQKKQE